MARHEICRKGSADGTEYALVKTVKDEERRHQHLVMRQRQAEESRKENEEPCKENIAPSPAIRQGSGGI
jgi:hypothetical protein